MSTGWSAEGKDRAGLMALLVKTLCYYGVLIGLIFFMITIWPASVDYLPVGGVSELSGSADLEISQLESALLSGDDEEDIAEGFAQTSPESRFLFHDALNLFISMIGTLILMLPVSWVYKEIHREGEHDHSLDETTLILPAVVAGIVIVVQHSLALAFSLAGIVAGVQFRRALSDTFDTLFIFVSIAVGIAAGISALDIAMVITMFFTLATLLVCIFGDGLESHHLAEKKRAKVAEKAAQAAKEENDS